MLEAARLDLGFRRDDGERLDAARLDLVFPKDDGKGIQDDVAICGGACAAEGR